MAPGAKPWIVGDTGVVPVDEFAQEGEFDVVGHHVWGSLNFSFLHEERELGHDLVFQLLQPFVELHVILIGAGVVVLPAPSLPPVGLRQFQRASDLAIECAIPIRGLSVQAYRENTRLNPELKDGATFAVDGAKDALLALIAASRAAGYVPKLRPGQVVGEHAQRVGLC